MTDPTIAAVEAGGLSFHYIEQGRGPLALCLHGFPDHASSFRHQLRALADMGYRAVAPYMRGYAPTGQPPDGCFQTASLGQDVIALINALGDGKAVVVGHDWGALAAYAAAVIAPDRIEKLVTMAIPYGSGFINALIGDPVQQRRSWYMFFFLTALAEPALARDDFALIERLWRDWSPGWSPAAEDLRAIKETFRQPGVVKAAISYYRFAFLRELQRPALADLQARIGREPIRVPTLYLHGKDDGCMGSEIGGDLQELFPAGIHKVIVPNAGHFLHLERPDLVNNTIRGFLVNALATC